MQTLYIGNIEADKRRKCDYRT